MSCFLLTGASGFLGKAIYSSLITHGHSVKTLGRGNANDYKIDLASESVQFNETFNYIVHAAGKAHIIPKRKKEEQDFYDTNLEGTRRLLEGLDKIGSLPLGIVFISSVSVYGIACGRNITENNLLLATDPYGKSKIEAEKLIIDWSNRNSVKCSILRLPLVAGNNPPGNLRSIISAVRYGYYFNVKHGLARKSMVLASDVAAIIPQVAQIGGIFNLTDGYHPSFKELSESIAQQLNKRPPSNMPLWLVKVMAKLGDFMGDKGPINSERLRKMTSDLIFDDSKAIELLGWKPDSVLKGFKI